MEGNFQCFVSQLAMFSLDCKNERIEIGGIRGQSVEKDSARSPNSCFPPQSSPTFL